MPEGSFESYINPCTLRFAKPEIEERYQQVQEGKVRGFLRSKQIVLAAAVILTLTSSIYAYSHYTKQEFGPFWALFYILIAGNSGIAVEFILHCFPSLRYLRCIFITAGLYFAAIYYPVHVLPAPGMQPGYFEAYCA